jgi:hypothetical protein
MGILAAIELGFGVFDVGVFLLEDLKVLVFDLHLARRTLTPPKLC